MHNLMMFGETLRKIGLDVGSSNMLDLVRSLEHIPIGRNQQPRMVTTAQQTARPAITHHEAKTRPGVVRIQR